METRDEDGSCRREVNVCRECNCDGVLGARPRGGLSNLLDDTGFSGVGGVQSDRSASERTRSILECEDDDFEEEEDALDASR